MRISIRQAFFIILFICIFLMTLRSIADPDYWWHLKTGELILQNHSIPHMDPFSYTKTGSLWITHEWLSEVMMYFLYRYIGQGVLIILFSLIITCAFALAYFRTEKGSRPYIPGFVVFLAAVSTAPTWGVRPQMLSLLLTSVILFLLDKYHHEGKITFLIPIPIIMVLWVNLHGGFFLGLVIIGITILGCLLEVLFSEYSLFGFNTLTPPSWKTIISLCVVLGVSVVAVLINPNGYHIILYPLQTLTSQSMQQLIQEWLSPNFHQLEWQPFAWLILALFAAGMLGKKTVSPSKILLTLVLGYASLRSMRNIPLFAVSVIPILSEQVSSIVRIKKEVKIPGKLIQAAFYMVIACIFFLTGFRYFQVMHEQDKVVVEHFPVNAVTWLEKEKPQGNIFNTYSWGGYLIWNLYPDYPVFIDGRADVYGDNLLFEYNSIYRAEPGWEEKLLSHNIKTVVIEPLSPLALFLKVSPGWEIAYEDTVCEVFIRIDNSS